VIICKNSYLLFYRETASETIRTLLAYGYNVEPPNPEAQGGTRGVPLTLSF